MKKKRLLLPLIILIGVYCSINIIHIGDYVYRDYIQRWFAPKGTVKELNLEYIGMEKVDINKERTFSEENSLHLQYTNAWQLSGSGEYHYFKDQIGFDNRLIGIRCSLFSDSYVISYGRKIVSASYDFSEYNNGLNTTSDYGSIGYYVHFIYDETEYYENTVFIYKCDRILIGNSWYLY